MATLKLFVELFDEIDKVTDTFVTDFISRSIIAITPIVSVCLTISFIAYSLLIIRGVVSMPMMEFLGKSLRIGIITSIALSGGLYQKNIAHAVRTLPDGLICALITDQSSKETMASALDKAAESGFNAAGKAYEKVGVFKGFVYALAALVMTITTGVLMAIGSGYLLIIKLTLAILVGLGPLFIVALLWQPTAKFFDSWTAQIMNYVILGVLFTAVLGLLISIFSNYASQIEFDGKQNISFSLGGMVILSMAMIIILLQIPSIASSLAGGISLSYLSELKSVARSGAGASVIAAKSAKGVGMLAVGGVRASIATGKGAATLARAAYGYYKGKK